MCVGARAGLILVMQASLYLGGDERDTAHGLRHTLALALGHAAAGAMHPGIAACSGPCMHAAICFVDAGLAWPLT